MERRLRARTAHSHQDKPNAHQYGQQFIPRRVTPPGPDGPDQFEQYLSDERNGFGNPIHAFVPPKRAVKDLSRPASHHPADAKKGVPRFCPQAVAPGLEPPPNTPSQDGRMPQNRPSSFLPHIASGRFFYLRVPAWPSRVTRFLRFSEDNLCRHLRATWLRCHHDAGRPAEPAQGRRRARMCAPSGRPTGRSGKGASPAHPKGSEWEPVPSRIGASP
jgi:hypothetical protein